MVPGLTEVSQEELQRFLPDGWVVATGSQDA